MIKKIVERAARHYGLIPGRSSITIIGCYFDGPECESFFGRLENVMDRHDGAVDVIVRDHNIDVIERTP